MADFSGWIGRSETQRDTITAGPLARLASLLDHQPPPWREGQVPPLGHWLFALPAVRHSDLGPDGHPARGGLLPFLPAPRRMWAGSRVRFAAPLRIGDQIERLTSIAAVTVKGAMTFVTLRHQISAQDRVCTVEEQDLVYLPARTANDPRRTPAD